MTTIKPGPVILFSSGHIVRNYGYAVFCLLAISRSRLLLFWTETNNGLGRGAYVRAALSLNQSQRAESHNVTVNQSQSESWAHVLSVTYTRMPCQRKAVKLQQCCSSAVLSARAGFPVHFSTPPVRLLTTPFTYSHFSYCSFNVYTTCSI